MGSIMVREKKPPNLWYQKDRSRNSSSNIYSYAILRILPSQSLSFSTCTNGVIMYRCCYKDEKPWLV